MSDKKQGKAHPPTPPCTSVVNSDIAAINQVASGYWCASTLSYQSGFATATDCFDYCLSLPQETTISGLYFNYVSTGARAGVCQCAKPAAICSLYKPSASDLAAAAHRNLAAGAAAARINIIPKIPAAYFAQLTNPVGPSTLTPVTTTGKQAW